MYAFHIPYAHKKSIISYSILLQKAIVHGFAASQTWFGLLILPWRSQDMSRVSLLM